MCGKLAQRADINASDTRTLSLPPFTLVIRLIILNSPATTASAQIGGRTKIFLPERDLQLILACLWCIWLCWSQRGRHSKLTLLDNYGSRQQASGRHEKVILSGYPSWSMGLTDNAQLHSGVKLTLSLWTTQSHCRSTNTDATPAIAVRVTLIVK